MNVLIACEESQRVCIRQVGYDYSFSALHQNEQRRSETSLQRRSFEYSTILRGLVRQGFISLCVGG